MSYATSDFSESLSRVDIKPSDIERVIAAWGGGDGQGTDTGNGWSEESVTDWAGGFLFLLRDGRYAYVWGWCDYTGWGCQDGAWVRYFDAEPTRESLTFEADENNKWDNASRAHDWDEAPADLNKWLAGGAKSLDDL